MGLGQAINSKIHGFSLVELLVALTVSGILLAMLSGAIRDITGSSVILDSKAENAKQRITLQRLFHRDVNNMADPESLAFEEEHVIFITSHSTLMDSPFPVKVTWDFSKKRITRTEEIEDMDYKNSSVIASGLGSWNFEAYDDKQNRWLNFNTLKAISAQSKEGVKSLSAMRMAANLGEVSMNTIERLPYAVLLQQAED